MKFIAVLAGRHKEFADFCLERKLKMRSGFLGYNDHADYIYIVTPRDCIGRHFDSVETIGSFATRADGSELAEAVNIRLNPTAG